jgi:phosphate uptake regulator
VTGAGPGARERPRSGTARRHPRPRASSYDLSLAVLRRKLAALCALVDREVELAAGTFSASAARRRDLRFSLRDLRMLARDAERSCQAILLLRHPASDLRLVTGALKIVPDLQRIGEIARRIRARNRATPRAGGAVDLGRLASVSRAQVRLAIGSVALEDVAAAQEAIADRESVAARHQVVISDVLALMMEDPAERSACRALLFIVRQLDALTEQAANVAQLVVSMMMGKSAEDLHAF